MFQEAYLNGLFYAFVSQAKALLPTSSCIIGHLKILTRARSLPLHTRGGNLLITFDFRFINPEFYITRRIDSDGLDLFLSKSFQPRSYYIPASDRFSPEGKNACFLQGVYKIKTFLFDSTIFLQVSHKVRSCADIHIL